MFEWREFRVNWFVGKETRFLEGRAFRVHWFVRKEIRLLARQTTRHTRHARLTRKNGRPIVKNVLKIL